MASSEISGKENWAKVSAQLDLALKKEIGIMREILANLHEEELALLENALARWSQVMDRRSELILQLFKLRKKRIQVGKPFKNQEIDSVDVLSKLDQLIALMDRINLQNCRNDALFDQAKQKGSLPLECNFPHPLHKPKRKNTVATYTKKR